MNRVLTLLCGILVILSRVLPHAPNLTPVFALLFFYSESQAKKSIHLVIIFAVLFWFLSDIFVSKIYETPLGFNGFVYLGVVMMCVSVYYFRQFISAKTHHNLYGIRFIVQLVLVMLYWVWTNFGVWVQGFYPSTPLGLLECYTAALPFLKNSLIGTGLGFIFFGVCVEYIFPQRRVVRWNRLSPGRA